MTINYFMPLITAVTPMRIQSMTQHEKLNYVEFPARDIPATKRFFEKAFGWSFEDFGSEYTVFTDQGIDGGFYKSELASTTANGSALLVLLSENLELTQSNVESAGGKISLPIFSFPGGQRFQFIEPSGNELAVWSE
jgi:predicted enzyme related to lactoylglutathione lyase